MLINETLKNLKLNKNIWGYDTFQDVPNQDFKYDKILGKKTKIKNDDQQNENDYLYPNIHKVEKNLKYNGFKKFKVNKG